MHSPSGKFAERANNTILETKVKRLKKLAKLLFWKNG